METTSPEVNSVHIPQEPERATPQPEMPNARRMFTSKASVIRHILAQVPEGEHWTAREIVAKAEALVRKLPEDMQEALLPMKINTVHYEIHRIKHGFTGPKESSSSPNASPHASPDAPPREEPKTASKRKDATSWNDLESNQIVNKIIELRLQDPLPSLLKLAQRAQEVVLPKERQRNLHNMDAIRGLLDKIHIKMAESRRLMERGRTPIVAPPPPPLVPAPVPVPAPAPLPSLEEILFDLSDETLLDTLRERQLSLSLMLPQLISAAIEHWNKRWKVTDELLALMKSHEEKIDSVIDYLTRPQPAIVPKQVIPPPPAPTPESKKAKKMRFLVVGLRNDHHHRIERSCGHLVDLRFSDMDEQTPPVGTSIDKVFFFGRYSNHSVREWLESHTTKDQFVQIRGGVEEGINIISKVARGEPVPAWNLR